MQGTIYLNNCDKLTIYIFDSMEAFEFVMKHATDGRVSQDRFLEAYGFTKPEQWARKTFANKIRIL